MPTNGGSLAERVAKIEAMLPANDRDGRDQWDAINDVRRGVTDLNVEIGGLKVEIGAVKEKNGLILEKLEEVKDRQQDATRQRTASEVSNAAAIDALTKKIDALTADVAVLKESRQSMGKLGTVVLSGLVSAAVALLAGFMNHSFWGK